MATKPNVLIYTTWMNLENGMKEGSYKGPHESIYVECPE
jgi:hypothetical protein